MFVSVWKQHVGICVLPRSSMFARFRKCSAPNPTLKTMCRARFRRQVWAQVFPAVLDAGLWLLDRTGPPKHHTDWTHNRETRFTAAPSAGRRAPHRRRPWMETLQLFVNFYLSYWLYLIQACGLRHDGSWTKSGLQD